MSAPLVLYCKSYRTDLLRLIRLAQSVEKYNVEKIPFYVSVPKEDVPIFRESATNLNFILLEDDQILAANPSISSDISSEMPSQLLQQVVKSEFWRLRLSHNYLCLDSDAFFIRPFSKKDYLHDDGTPYTVIHEAHELIEMAYANNKPQIHENFIKEALQLQNLFKRSGRAYSFGPMPMVWHSAVWESLDREFLKPRGMSFANAIHQFPLESRWYGEALFAYQAIKLLPCEPFFKVFYYAWQYDQKKTLPDLLQQLSHNYSGVILQSSWERELDWPPENRRRISSFIRYVKRKMKKI